jgi:hypothetical protein
MFILSALARLVLLNVAKAPEEKTFLVRRLKTKAIGLMLPHLQL